MTAKKKSSTDGKSVNLARHKAQCTICAHAECTEVEAGFVNWESPAKLAGEYGLADRTTVYRHAHALGLFDKRKRNVRAALERIIEKSGDVEVTASAVVAAIQAYAKINAQGQWVERSEHVNLNELFAREQRRAGALRPRRQTARLVYRNGVNPGRNGDGRWERRLTWANIGEKTRVGQCCPQQI